jgi:transposase-like protein
MKTELRALARRIRAEEGASINEIARRTGAAKSSISRWVRDVELTADQRETLRIRAYNGHVKGRTMNSALRREARLLAQEDGRVRALRGDPMLLAGCMLYWAEGAKSRNQVRFVNSDPELIRFFVKFLRECFAVRDEEMRLRCNLFADHLERQRDVEQFWLDTTQLPRSRLGRSAVNRYSKYSKKKRKNRLPYGTCELTVSRTRIIQAIYGAIQEYAGFERPEWLDA